MANLQEQSRNIIALAAATAALACVCAVLNTVGSEVVLCATIWGVLAALNVVNVILRIKKLKKNREDTFDEQKTV